MEENIVDFYKITDDVLELVDKMGFVTEFPIDYGSFRQSVANVIRSELESQGIHVRDMNNRVDDNVSGQ